MVDKIRYFYRGHEVRNYTRSAGTLRYLVSVMQYQKVASLVSSIVQYQPSKVRQWGANVDLYMLIFVTLKHGDEEGKSLSQLTRTAITRCNDESLCSSFSYILFRSFICRKSSP